MDSLKAPIVRFMDTSEISVMKVYVVLLLSLHQPALATENFYFNFSEDSKNIENIIALKFQDLEPISTSNMSAPDGFQLTESKMNQRGAIWYANTLDSRVSFTTSFDFVMDKLGGITAEHGGDGIALVIQSEGNQAIGSNNGGIGYMGIQSSLAVELDTWNNQPYGDPNGNHVAIMSRADQFNLPDHRSAEVASRKVHRPLNDGKTQNLTVTYSNQVMKVYLNRKLVLSAPLELTKLVKEKFWIGITAATGGSTERHIIRNWKFSQLEKLH